jgi:hypothetical protein
MGWQAVINMDKTCDAGSYETNANLFCRIKGTHG